MSIYLQQHPLHPERHVNVVIMDNYYSTDYEKKIPTWMNKMKFQNMNNKSGVFFRLASILDNDTTPKPLMTFGNTSNNLRLHEATPDISQYEKDVLTMARFMYSLFDEVISEAKMMLKDTMSKNALDATLTNTEDVVSNFKELHCDEGVSAGSSEIDVGTPFVIPVGKDSPNDSPNSIASHASRMKYYDHHTDSGKFRPDTHDNAHIESHEDLMRITTQCLAYTLDGTPVPPELIGIRHGLPGTTSGNHKFCTHVGYFCSKRKAFVSCAIKNYDYIPMEGIICSHTQMIGSQNELHHFFKSLDSSDKKNNVVRCILSPRKFQDKHLTEDRQLRYFGKAPRVHSHDLHNVHGVIDMLQGRARRFQSSNSVDVPEPMAKRQRMTVTQATEKNPTSSTNGHSPTSKKLWGATEYRTGALMPEEEIERKETIGIKSTTYPTSDLARSIDVARALYKMRVSLNLKMEAIGDVTVGPLTVTNPDGIHRLMRPGEKFDSNKVDSRIGIQANKHMKNIYDTDTGDFIHLRHASTNSAELPKNVLHALTGDGNGFVDMKIRGSGGAIEVAGSKVMQSASKHAHRDAPNYFVASGQVANKDKNLDLQRACLKDRCMNVFLDCDHVECLYVGPFVIKETRLKRYTENEAQEQIESMNALNRKLHCFAPEMFRKEALGEEDLLYIASMTEKGYVYVLEPLARDFRNSYFHDGQKHVPWELFNATVDDFNLPSVSVPHEKVSEVLGVGRTFFNRSSLVQFGSFSFLKKDAKMRLLKCLAEEDEEDETDNEDDINISLGGDIKKKKMTPDDIICAAVHVSGATWAKSCYDCIEGNDTILPASRKLYCDMEEGNESNTYTSYENFLELTNTRAVHMRSAHPALVNPQEPPVNFAFVSTGSFDPSFKEVNDI